MTNLATPPEMVGDFVEEAIGYEAALTKGTSQAERCIGRALDLGRRLQQEEGGRTLLLGLLQNENLAVRYMSALAVHDSAPMAAMHVLREITQSAHPRTLLRPMAQLVLMQWKSGQRRS